MFFVLTKIYQILFFFSIKDRYFLVYKIIMHVILVHVVKSMCILE
jgi:hypothetical protein